jgi:hypothetical protein
LNFKLFLKRVFVNQIKGNDDKEIEDESFYDDMPPLIHIDPKDYNFEIFYVL